MEKTITVTEALEILGKYASKIVINSDTSIDLYPIENGIARIQAMGESHGHCVNILLQDTYKSVCRHHAMEHSKLDKLDGLYATCSTMDTPDAKLKWLNTLGAVRVTPNNFDWSASCDSSLIAEEPVRATAATAAQAIEELFAAIMPKLLAAQTTYSVRLDHLHKELQQLDAAVFTSDTEV